MSELAYNLQGERFQPPASASSWRVRRLKPGGRGTPDVVFGKDGAPLMLSLETDLLEFRRVVGNHPGRYRLDPVTEDHRPCEGGLPAYLHLEERDDSVETSAALPRNGGASDDLVRELVRVNAEMCRSMADRFASVMDSAAVLVRAAAGAGLPSREPAVIPLPDAYRNAPLDAVADDDDDDDDDDADDELPTLATVLQTTIDRAMPLVNHAVNTKVLGLTTEQSIALMGGGAVSAHANAAPHTTTSEPDATAAPASPPRPPASPADFMAHLLAVEAQLTTAEAQLARAAVGQMPPEALAAWREKILAMTPTEAAAMVRAEINKRRTSTEPPQTKKEAA